MEGNSPETPQPDQQPEDKTTRRGFIGKLLKMVGLGTAVGVGAKALVDSQQPNQPQVSGTRLPETRVPQESIVPQTPLPTPTRDRGYVVVESAASVTPTSDLPETPVATPTTGSTSTPIPQNSPTPITQS